MQKNVGGVGALIRARREAAGVTAVDLATAAGISRQYLCDMEKGVRRVPVPLWRRFVAAIPTIGLYELAMAAISEGPVTVDASVAGIGVRRMIAALFVAEAERE